MVIVNKVFYKYTLYYIRNVIFLILNTVLYKYNSAKLLKQNCAKRLNLVKSLILDCNDLLKNNQINYLWGIICRPFV